MKSALVERLKRAAGSDRSIKGRKAVQVHAGITLDINLAAEYPEPFGLTSVFLNGHLSVEGL